MNWLSLSKYWREGSWMKEKQRTTNIQEFYLTADTIDVGHLSVPVYWYKADLQHLECYNGFPLDD